jgi:hypothetical protein
VTRLAALIAIFLLSASCQNEPHAVFSPAPSPSPRTAPTAAILQSADVPATVSPCVGSGPLDVYLSMLATADPALADRLSNQWADLLSHGARAGAISVYTANPTACQAELGATTTVKSVASVVIQFEDEGQADRAWQAGVFGFVPPAAGEVLPGLSRGTTTGLGLSSFTYERPSVRLACWRHSVYVALVVVSNFDLNTFTAATAAVDPRLN